jgi:hypothetical protein
LLQASQGPFFCCFGVVGLAQGASQAVLATPTTDLHDKAPWLGMEELRLELHGLELGALGWVSAF